MNNLSLQAGVTVTNLKSMVASEISKPIETMTSLEIVSLINKGRKIEGGAPMLAHADFMKKVPQVLGEKDVGNFSEIYLDAYKREQPCYRLPRRETMLMLMSYSYELQAAVYDRMVELESSKLNTLSIPNFADPAEAAIAWAEQYRAAQLAISTKAEIGSRREATAMNTASQAVKKVNALQVELDRSQEWSTIKRMEIITGLKFNWRILKSAGIDLGIEPQEVFDPNFGTVKSYHADVWREAYALDIKQ